MEIADTAPAAASEANPTTEMAEIPAESTIPQSPAGLKRLRGKLFTKKKVTVNADKTSNEGILPTEDTVGDNEYTPSNNSEPVQQTSWFDPTTLSNQVNAYFGSSSSQQRYLDHNPIEDAKEYFGKSLVISSQQHWFDQRIALEQAKEYIDGLNCNGFANCGTSVDAHHGSVDDRNDPDAAEERRGDHLCEEEQRQPDTTVQRQEPPTSAGVATEEGILNEAKIWKPIFDSKSRRYYYYHKQTKAVRWDKPPRFDEAINIGKNKWEWVTVDDMLEARKWWTAYDVNSDKYYYYDKDGNTNWKKPKGFDEISKQRISKRRSPK